MDFVPSKVVSLKAHQTYNEKWLQGLIADDPGLLGLGHLIVKDIERRQPRAGRLDLLLADPETHTRYEVEIQLGATDEAHHPHHRILGRREEPLSAIRARRRTHRGGHHESLPERHHAVQQSDPAHRRTDARARSRGLLTLNATTVLDLTALGTEDEDEPGQATDRSYWVTRSSTQSVALADEVEKLIQTVEPGITLKYNKYYIGLAHGGVPYNFVIFWARRDHLIGGFKIPRTDEMTALIEDSGLDSLEYEKRGGRYRIRLTAADLAERRDAVMELIRRANGSPAVDEPHDDS